MIHFHFTLSLRNHDHSKTNFYLLTHQLAMSFKQGWEEPNIFRLKHWVFAENPVFANKAMCIRPLLYNLDLSTIKPNKTGFCWTSYDWNNPFVKNHVVPSLVSRALRTLWPWLLVRVDSGPWASKLLTDIKLLSFCLDLRSSNPPPIGIIRILLVAASHQTPTTQSSRFTPHSNTPAYSSYKISFVWDPRLFIARENETPQCKRLFDWLGFATLHASTRNTWQKRSAVVFPLRFSLFDHLALQSLNNCIFVFSWLIS